MCDCVYRQLRAFFCGLCCVACIGPILIVVGIVLLTTENTRDADIASWKSTIITFDTNQRAAMLATSGSVNGAVLSISEPSVLVVGDQTNIPSTTSVVLTGGAYAASQWEFQTAVGGSATNGFNVTTSLTSTRTTSVYCTKSQCTSSCGKSDYYCGSMVSRACDSGGAYSGSVGCWNSDGACGTCTYVDKLSDVCVPLSFAPDSDGNNSTASGKWLRSTRRSGCAYPFTSPGTYAASASSMISVRAMSEDDPYITLQAATSGTADFGMTEETQKSTGTGALVAGIVLSLCIYGIVALLIHRCILTPRRNGIDPFAPGYTGNPIYGGGPIHGAGAMMGQPMMAFGGGPQPMGMGNGFGMSEDKPHMFNPAVTGTVVPYGQPQQPYGQPSQPYGQPPQPYGQPPQPYGQPPPSFGLPPQPYGQPPPPAYDAPMQPYGQPPQPYGQPPAY
jgi:hypothetical protein